MSHSQRSQRSMLLEGLYLTLVHPGAVLWTYAANLVLALLFTIRLHTQLAALLDHSLESQKLTAAFDLGTAFLAMRGTTHGVPSANAGSWLSIPLYLAIYFLLVPGALFTYRVQAPAQLSILLRTGARMFWRFVRITLVTVIFSAAVLTPLTLLATAWSGHIDERMVGWQALALQALGWVVVLFVAILLRLYFDLVQVYTVQLDDQLRVSGFPDRRVRRVLLPALSTLARHLPRASAVFVTLLALGLLVYGLLGRVAVHMLAQPRVWPMFLLVQVGLFATIFTRFWQRAAETVLAADNPLAQEAVVFEEDPLPGPEPIAPSLDGPDEGVFHREVGPLA